MSDRSQVSLAPDSVSDTVINMWQNFLKSNKIFLILEFNWKPVVYGSPNLFCGLLVVK